MFEAHCARRRSASQFRAPRRPGAAAPRDRARASFRQGAPGDLARTGRWGGVSCRHRSLVRHPRQSADLAATCRAGLWQDSQSPFEFRADPNAGNQKGRRPGRGAGRGL